MNHQTNQKSFTKMDEDPFASIVKHCLPTSSQQDKFRNCPFARESDVFPDSEDSQLSPLEPTGIVMVSLPETSNDDNTPHEDDEEFQTASDRSQSALVSSEEQGQVIVAVDLDRKVDGVGEGNVSDGCADAEIAVDLDKDNDDNLGFLEPKLQVEIGDGDGDGGDVNGGDPKSYGFERELKEFTVFEGESSVSKNLGVCDETVVLDKKMVVESDPNENGDTENEVPESGFEEDCEGLGDRLNENKENVVLPVKVRTPSVCENATKNIEDLDKSGVCENATKNIEDLNKFKYTHLGSVDRCTKGKVVGAKRELPFTIRTNEKNVGGGSKSGGSSLANNRILNDLYDVLKMVVDEFDDGYEDSDFFKTAKKRGLTFPHPRWWPPEGFDD